jgi:hypothetical protein
VRNLSPSGALLDGGSLPAPGAKVRLLRGALSAHGEIAWQSGEQAGVRFAEPIGVAEWVKRVGHPGQQRVDEAIAALRGRDPVARSGDKPAAPSLDGIAAEIHAICERLAGSSSMTVELAEELVKLDTLAQAIRRLAPDCAP